jgi:hypothetical protein
LVGYAGWLGVTITATAAALLAAWFGLAFREVKRGKD